VNPQNSFAQSLSFGQLAQIFSGAARSWDQVDPSFPAQPIRVFSPGTDSGTFDYFVEIVLDGEGDSLANLEGAVLSEDDNELARGIEGDPNAIGFFGYAYVQQEGELLRAVAIDAGQGAVAPGADTVSDGSYPLARPLFVYSSPRDLKVHPAAAAFLSYYLQNVNDVIDSVGYFPATDATLAEAQQLLIAALN
jgi:ABC-type phosphate transport system substrate-binding protein